MSVFSVFSGLHIVTCGSSFFLSLQFVRCCFGASNVSFEIRLPNSNSSILVLSFRRRFSFLLVLPVVPQHP